MTTKKQLREQVSDLQYLLGQFADEADARMDLLIRQRDAAHRNTVAEQRETDTVRAHLTVTTRELAAAQAQVSSMAEFADVRINRALAQRDEARAQLAAMTEARDTVAAVLGYTRGENERLTADVEDRERISDLLTGMLDEATRQLSARRTDADARLRAAVTPTGRAVVDGRLEFLSDLLD